MFKMSPSVKQKQIKRPDRLPPLAESKVLVAPLVAPIPLLAPRVSLPPLAQPLSEIIQLPPLMRAPVTRLLPPLPVTAPEPTTPRLTLLPPPPCPPAPTKTLPKYNCYDMETCNCKCDNPLHTRSVIMLAKATMRGILWGDILDDWTYEI